MVCGSALSEQACTSLPVLSSASPVGSLKIGYGGSIYTTSKYCKASALGGGEGGVHKRKEPVVKHLLA